MRYTIKHYLYAGILCLVLPSASFAATLSDALDNLSDLSRSADDARAAYDHAKNSGGDYSSHERQWRERENSLEDARVEKLAKESGVSKSKIREMRRDGESWENIASRNGQDPARYGYGSSRYDHDRDNWKGMPPGQAKKMNQGRDYDDGRYHNRDNDRNREGEYGRNDRHGDRNRDNNYRDRDGKYHERDNNYRDRDGKYHEGDDKYRERDQQYRHRDGNADSDRKYHRDDKRDTTRDSDRDRRSDKKDRKNKKDMQDDD